MRYLQTLLDRFAVRGAVAEIGTFKGQGSAPVLYDHVRRHGGALYCVDLFRDPEDFRAVRERFDPALATLIKGYSVEAGLAFTQRLRFLFIDGDHGFPRLSGEGVQSGVALDILAWAPRLEPGGALVFHDYTGTDERYGEKSLMAVEQAVDALCRPPFFEPVGAQGSFRAFVKTREGVLHPRPRVKAPCEAVRPAWERLGARPDLFGRGAVIYGTGESGKQVLDSLTELCGPSVPVRFTSSGCAAPGAAWEGRPLSPLDEALRQGGGAPLVIASIHEEEIAAALEARGLRHLDDYFKFYEYISWFHIGRFQASRTWGQASRPSGERG